MSSRDATPTRSVIRLFNVRSINMSMSVDGFITRPDDSKEHGSGVGGERLHA